ncbi:MAG: chalcone isomerase family protein [Bdellovibrionales bacterium]|nr:chalcone isomerase family protein [Bdellovibrionales bacterium]
MLAFICSATLPAHAAELAGATLPDSVSVGDQRLVLNGLGLREATVFKVDVYVAGLYLSEKQSSAQSILADARTKQLTLHFLRDVERDKIVAAWKTGFAANTPDLAPIADRIAEFNRLMTDMHHGEQLVLRFYADTVEVILREKSVGRIRGSAFARAVLAIWLGDAPPNESLKRGLLGTAEFDS